MNNNYWSTANSPAVTTYLGKVCRTPLDAFRLPSPRDITSTNPPRLNTSLAPIDGLTLGRGALRGESCIKVGQRIYIQDYKNEDISDEANKCPFPRFAYCVLRDLRTIATTVVGKRLLHSLDRNGGTEKVRIKFGHGLPGGSSQCNQLLGQDFHRLRDGQPGAPCSSTVQYNPLFFGLPKFVGTNDRHQPLLPGNWGHPAQKPGDVTVFHELVHADDMLRGIFDQIELPRGGRTVKISEMRCVGLDLFNNASMVTENNYRRQRGFLRRYSYANGDITRRSPAVTPRYQALVEHLDKCLIGKAAFVRATRRAGKRNKILDVEQPLVTYNRNYAWMDNPLDKLPGLMALLNEVMAYTRRRNAKRNVSSLIYAIGTEMQSVGDEILRLRRRRRL